jgi:tRNA (cmo5U34)-methyltransferase
MTTGLDVPARWTFRSPNVAEHFDAHVREQLPWYELATSAIAFLARHYIQPGSLVYDLGCATGNVGRAIAATLEERRAELVAIDESEDMLERYEAPGRIELAAIERYEYARHSLAISLLATQFTPPGARAELLDRLVNAALPGGAVILLEKWLPELADPDAETALYRLTLDAKLRAGATPEEIVAKELSLVGAQRPLDPRLLERHPRSTTFFRFGHFAGVVLPARS